MTNEYGIEATREEQRRLRDVAELDNIRRLRKNVDEARAALNLAIVQRQNRIMLQED